jgi:hypothetical protein
MLVKKEASNFSGHDGRRGGNGGPGEGVVLSNNQIKKNKKKIKFHGDLSKQNL